MALTRNRGSQSRQGLLRRHNMEALETSITAPWAPRRCWLMCSSNSPPNHFHCDSSHATANHHDVAQNSGDDVTKISWRDMSDLNDLLLSPLLQSDWFSVVECVDTIKLWIFRKDQWIDRKLALFKINGYWCLLSTWFIIQKHHRI